MASNLSENIRKFKEEKRYFRLSKEADLALNTVVKIETGKVLDPTVETLKKSLKHPVFPLEIYLRNNL